MADLTDFQLEVTRLFFSLPGSRGFLLAGAEHLHGVPETYDPRWIVRHVYHHPGVDVMHCSRISSWILLDL
jgi:hypothetical protein